MQSAKNFWPGSDASTTERRGGERRSSGTSTSLPELPSHLVVQRVLGEGGTSTVYRALHMRLKVPVAIKVLARLEDHEEEARERLLREAELCARLSDSRFPRIYDVDTLPDGTPYIVMEYIAGRNLAELIACGPMEVDTACAITREVLEALVDIHEIGIIHRDIKPANIILEESPGRAPRVRVVDFGIAKTVQPYRAWQPLTQQGAMVGTPHYMAPEQIRGQELDARVDLYAVGAMLYELLSGRPAFSGATLGEVIAATLRDQPLRLGELCSEVSPELEAFVMKAMARERQNRFDSAVEMLAALHEVQYIGSRDDTEVLDGRPTLDDLPMADEARSGLLAVARSQRPSLLIVPDPEWNLDDAPGMPVATPLSDTGNHARPSRHGWKLMYACVAAGALAAIVWPSPLSDPGPVSPLPLASGAETFDAPEARAEFSTPPAAAAPVSAPQTAATPQALTTGPAASQGPEPIIITPGGSEEVATESARKSGERVRPRSSTKQQPAESSQMLRRYLSELEKLSVPAPPAHGDERDAAEARSEAARNRDDSPQREKSSIGSLPANPY